MKKSFLSMAALAMMLLGAMSACSQKSPYPGYELSATGLNYQFFKQNNEAPQPKVGDLIDMRIFAAVSVR